MIKDHCLAKSIADAAWNKLITATKYKAESAGSMVVLVNPANTSKMCSRCGLIMDRDHNAAINVLRLGLQSVGIKTVEAHRL